MKHPNKITLIKPDDFHLHLRQGDYLKTTVIHSAERFARAIVMPNLKPPVTTVEAALSYRQEILKFVPSGLNFQPLMALYLTDQTTPATVIAAKESEPIIGFKLYPAGATTHSEAGVTSLEKIYPVLAALEEHQVPLLIHGEVTDPTTDLFDREKLFLERELSPIIQDFPQLRIVLEHITTKDAVDFVKASPNNLAATITVHHLLLNRNHMLVQGIKPHFYCLPILKRQEHQTALIAAATSGNPKFFLGTDSAPHTRLTKENACGCAGIYSAPLALELYTEVFAQAGALDKLEAFASINGADFYQLPHNQEHITLIQENWQAPASYRFGEDEVIPLRANQEVQWKIIRCQ